MFEHFGEFMVTGHKLVNIAFYSNICKLYDKLIIGSDASHFLYPELNVIATIM